jgi:hypothetical protein
MTRSGETEGDAVGGMAAKQVPAIVIGGHHSALGVVRALGMRGVYVILLTYQGGGLACDLSIH